MQRGYARTGFTQPRLQQSPGLQHPHPAPAEPGDGSSPPPACSSSWQPPPEWHRACKRLCPRAPWPACAWGCFISSLSWVLVAFWHNFLKFLTSNHFLVVVFVFFNARQKASFTPSPSKTNFQLILCVHQGRAVGCVSFPPSSENSKN